MTNEFMDRRRESMRKNGEEIPDRLRTPEEREQEQADTSSQTFEEAVNTLLDAIKKILPESNPPQIGSKDSYSTKLVNEVVSYRSRNAPEELIYGMILDHVALHPALAKRLVWHGILEIDVSTRKQPQEFDQ